MSVADLKAQSPRFAIIPQRNLPANDTKATAVQGCRKPTAWIFRLGEQASAIGQSPLISVSQLFISERSGRLKPGGGSL
jgi:hypothetical protein